MQNKSLFKRIGMSIVIPLNYRGYQIRANIFKKQNTEFTVTYEIGLEGSSTWSCIEGDSFTIQTEGNINFEVFKYTMDKFAGGYFKPFIDRYAFEFAAMNQGITQMESERLHKC